MRKRNTQTTLGDALSGYLRRLDRGGNLTQARVVEAWPKAVGPDIARHTSGVHVRGDELVVYVDSPVWATELSALSTQLAQRLNECLGEDLVGAMRFTVSRKVSEQRTREAQSDEDDLFYAEDKVEPVPLGEAELEQVRQSAAAIRNLDLRETVIRATVKDLEWKRGIEQRDSLDPRGAVPPPADDATGVERGS